MARRVLPVVPAGLPLDYYLLRPERGPAAAPAAVLVEEFVLAADGTAVGLDSAGFGSPEDGWWSSAEFCRGMRRDPHLRARVRPVSRPDAEEAFARLGGGPLPDEQWLRGRFRDRHPLGGTAPLRLGPDAAPPGFRERRVYRILFAGELRPEGLARALAAWDMTPAADLAAPDCRVAGTARRSVGDDELAWDLRRIGPGVAWCADLTALLREASDAVVQPVLAELRAVLRSQGLIPVTVERFA